jgi:hypothetical protein
MCERLQCSAVKVLIHLQVWLASPPRGAWLRSQARRYIHTHTHIYTHIYMYIYIYIKSAKVRLVTLHTRTSLTHWNPRLAGLASQTRMCMDTLRKKLRISLNLAGSCYGSVWLSYGENKWAEWMVHKFSGKLVTTPKLLAPEGQQEASSYCATKILDWPLNLIVNLTLPARCMRTETHFCVWWWGEKLQ